MADSGRFNMAKRGAFSVCLLTESVICTERNGVSWVCPGCVLQQCRGGMLYEHAVYAVTGIIKAGMQVLAQTVTLQDGNLMWDAEDEAAYALEAAHGDIKYPVIAIRIAEWYGLRMLLYEEVVGMHGETELYLLRLDGAAAEDVKAEATVPVSLSPLLIKYLNLADAAGAEQQVAVLFKVICPCIDIVPVVVIRLNYTVTYAVAGTGLIVDEAYLAVLTGGLEQQLGIVDAVLQIWDATDGIARAVKLGIGNSGN